MKKLLVRFVRETEGQDLIEYALLAAIIAIGATLAMSNLSSAINGQFDAVSTAVSS